MSDTPTPFSKLISSMAPKGDGFEAHVTPDWQQGRTTYGGLSAALCVEAALRAHPALPPLRAAQFNFIGPAGGTLLARPSLLRQGKSATFIGVDLEGEQGLATRAVLTFGSARDTGVRFIDKPMPQVPGPDEATDFFRGRMGPTFAQHFEFGHVGGPFPMSGGEKPEYLLWLRHRDRAVPASITPLVALADAPPPASFGILREPRPISTMTWMIELLSDNVADHGEWRLMRGYSESVKDGYSAQEQVLWSQSGEPLLIARQTVAMF